MKITISGIRGEGKTRVAKIILDALVRSGWEVHLDDAGDSTSVFKRMNIGKCKMTVKQVK